MICVLWLSFLSSNEDACHHKVCITFSFTSHKCTEIKKNETKSTIRKTQLFLIKHWFNLPIKDKQTGKQSKWECHKDQPQKLEILSIYAE